MSFSNTKSPLLGKAQVEHTAAGALFSEQFQDIYFSKAGGFAESTHVFIHGNKLLERWKNTEHFVIGELGFGTGLNFVNTVKHWQEHAPSHAQLHYISCEYYPLEKKLFRKFWQQFPEYQHISATLLTRLPSALPGFHRIHFPEFNCILTLLFGEATTMCQQLNAQVDAWFLDGFSPAKNPELWNAELLQKLGQLTALGGTCATYSVARSVHENLQAAGFVTNKQRGFAEKKEMLCGIKQGHKYSQPSHQAKSAIIVGGSLAGCSTAAALAQRGWEVIVLEKRSLAQLSANHDVTGITYPLLSSDWNELTQLSCNGMLYTLHLLQVLKIKNAPQVFQQCGMKIFATRPREQERFMKLQNFAWMPEDFMQFLPKKSSANFDMVSLSQAAWIKPSAFIANLLQNPLIRYFPEQDVTELHCADRNWCAQTSSGSKFSAEHVVIANAFEAKQLLQTAQLPLQSIRGQVTYLPTSPELKTIHEIMCAEGYLSPELNGFHHLGASYDLESQATDLLPESHQQNLHHLKNLLPSSHVKYNVETLGGRVGFRTTAPDRTPIVGMHPHEYKLWLNLAHGSRGLISCPLAGEHLASLMNSDPMPLPATLVKTLSPERFLE